MTIPFDSRTMDDLKGLRDPYSCFRHLYEEYYRDPDLFDSVDIDCDGNIIIDTDNGFIMIG